MTAAKRYARYRWELYGYLGRLRAATIACSAIRHATTAQPYSHDIAGAVVDAETALIALRSALNNHLLRLKETDAWKQL